MKKNIITALVVAGAMLMSAPVYAASQKTETEIQRKEMLR